MFKLLVVVLVCAVGCFGEEIGDKSTTVANKCGLRNPNGVGSKTTGGKVNEAKYGNCQI